MLSLMCKIIFLCLCIYKVYGNIQLIMNTKLDLHHVLEANKDTTLPSCADKCVYKTDCVSFSFSRVTKVCEMYRMSVADVPSGDKYQQDFTVLMEAMNWPKSRTGVCSTKPCAEKTTCVPTGQTYVCQKDKEVGCKLFLPEHGFVRMNPKEGLYPIGITIGLDCKPPYYSGLATRDEYFNARCLADLTWNYSYSCFTVEELCTHNILEKFYPNRTEINVTSAVPDWNVTDVFLTSADGWRAATNDGQQYLQIRFDTEYSLGGLITKGGANGNWVKSYNVTYSRECTTYSSLTDSDNGTAQEFLGNTNASDSVKNIFDRIIHTQCLRIHPTDYEGGISMRLEILGCVNY